MPAMRLYSREELEALLTSHGCVKTEEHSQTTHFWYTNNGVLFSVPEPDSTSDMYSDFVFYKIKAFIENN